MSLKRLLYAISSLGLLLPFVLITNFYPFVRFGMFAEPIRYQQQKESFIVTLNGELINGHGIGIDPNNFTYLVRNHVYRGDQSLLLRKLEEISPSKQHNWKLFKKTVDGDTVLLENFHAK